MFLTVDEAYVILFDTFEMSQGDGGIQLDILSLLALKFPNLRLPSQYSFDLQDRLAKELEKFLTDGKHHTGLDKPKISAGAEVEVNDLEMVLNRSENASILSPKSAQTLAHQIFYKILTREEVYLNPDEYSILNTPGKGRPHSDDESRFSSYLRKYFVEHRYSKNRYLREVFEDVQRVFDEYVEKIFPGSEDAVTILEQKTNGFVFDSDTYNPDQLDQRLLHLASNWEKLHPNEKFWVASLRTRRKIE